MAKNKREIVRLIINLVLIALIVVGIVFIARKFFAKKDKSWQLEETALKVESIRKIAELSTVSYQDELVLDSIEYYEGTFDQVAGNLKGMQDAKNWKYSIRGSNIKRRLTLVIGGEVRYGFDLKNSQFDVRANADTVWYLLPQPQILEVISLPSKTTVFQEHGEWSDNARLKLQKKAEKKFRNFAKTLDLETKSKMQVESLLRKLVVDKRTIIFQYQ